MSVTAERERRLVMSLVNTRAEACSCLLVLSTMQSSHCAEACTSVWWLSHVHTLHHKPCLAKPALRTVFSSRRHAQPWLLATLWPCFSLVESVIQWYSDWLRSRRHVRCEVLWRRWPWNHWCTSVHLGEQTTDCAVRLACALGKEETFRAPVHWQCKEDFTQFSCALLGNT